MVIISWRVACEQTDIIYVVSVAALSNYLIQLFPTYERKKLLTSQKEEVANEDQICCIQYKKQDLWKEFDRKEMIVHPIISCFLIATCEGQRNSGWDITLGLPNAVITVQPMKGHTL